MGMRAIELTPAEFSALLDRLGGRDREAAETTCRRPDGLGECYAVTLYPIMFWVKDRSWERHKLRALVARLSSAWKDTLTEPTLQKIRALLAEEPGDGAAVGSIATALESRPPGRWAGITTPGG